MEKHKLLLVLTKAQHDQLKKLAAKVGITVSAQARIAIQAYLDGHMADKRTPPNKRDLVIAEYQKYIADIPQSFTSEQQARDWMAGVYELRKQLTDMKIGADEARELTPLPHSVIDFINSQHKASVPVEGTETPESIAADLSRLAQLASHD